MRPLWGASARSVISQAPQRRRGQACASLENLAGTRPCRGSRAVRVRMCLHALNMMFTVFAYPNEPRTHRSRPRPAAGTRTRTRAGDRRPPPGTCLGLGIRRLCMGWWSGRNSRHLATPHTWPHAISTRSRDPAAASRPYTAPMTAPLGGPTLRICKRIAACAFTASSLAFTASASASASPHVPPAPKLLYGQFESPRCHPGIRAPPCYAICTDMHASDLHASDLHASDLHASDLHADLHASDLHASDLHASVHPCIRDPPCYHQSCVHSVHSLRVRRFALRSPVRPVRQL